MELPQFCGRIAFIGRSNVGKSTLLNALLEKKISITSRKPQTTRYSLVGVHTDGCHQLVFVDTPGIQLSPKNAMNARMNYFAWSALRKTDIVAFVTEGLRWTSQEDALCAKMPREVRRLWIINKVDRIVHRERLLPYIDQMRPYIGNSDVIPISAYKRKDVLRLRRILQQQLPEAPHEYPEDTLTNKNMSFFISEGVRQQCMRFLGDELPYELAILIESFAMGPDNHYHAQCVVLVHRASQKKILIGAQGKTLKKITEHASAELARRFDCAIDLHIWVQVRPNWINHPGYLNQLGFK